MALEQAGVDLQAKNFRDYINKLNQIDRAQQNIFDANAKPLEQSYDSATRAARNYEQQQKKISQQTSTLGAGFKTLGVAIAGAFTVREIAQFSRESLDLARTQAKAEAQVAAAIRSTGGAAGLTSQQLRDLATGFQQTTNFGDEATLQAEALLVTFKQVGSEIFPRTTAAILDTATAMDQGLKETTIQVGKALNDPIQGLTALRRSGIQFTDEQERQIKTQVESNRVFEAQNIILTELESQFGGSAAAAREADGGFIALQNSVGDLKEEIGFLILGLNEASNATGGSNGFVGQLTMAVTAAQQLFVIIQAGVDATNAALNSIQVPNLQALFTPQGVAQGAFNLGQQLFGGATGGQGADIAGAGETFTSTFEERFKALSAATRTAFDDAAAGIVPVTDGLGDITDATDDATDATKAYQNAVRQAGRFQLQQVRQIEDAQRQLARQQEDAARRLARELADIEKERIASIEEANAGLNQDLMDLETEGAKEVEDTRREAARDRERQQRELHRRLRQAEEQFNLSQLQSSRRFQLQDRRLRAEGDILALQQLREDQALSQQEAEENFDLSQKQQKESGQAQIDDQEEQLQERLDKQREALNQEREQLRVAFNEQLDQIDARAEEQRLRLAESEQLRLEDQQIALQRQEEDRQIAYQRQLQDLGASLAEQEGVTQEGAQNIANQLAEVFGEDGAANLIMQGFLERTESGFTDLFNMLEAGTQALANLSGGGSFETAPNPFAPTQIPGFQHGGAFTVGGQGGPDSQIVAFRATPGERVNVTPQTQTIAAPISALRQTLQVQMSGGFNISGAEGASAMVIEATLDQVVSEVGKAFRALARQS